MYFFYRISIEYHTVKTCSKAEECLEIFLILITASHFVLFAPTKEKKLPVLIRKDAECTRGQSEHGKQKNSCPYRESKPWLFSL